MSYRVIDSKAADGYYETHFLIGPRNGTIGIIQHEESLDSFAGKDGLLQQMNLVPQSVEYMPLNEGQVRLSRTTYVDTDGHKTFLTVYPTDIYVERAKAAGRWDIPIFYRELR